MQYVSQDFMYTPPSCDQTFSYLVYTHITFYIHIPVIPMPFDVCSIDVLFHGEITPPHLSRIHEH